VTVIGTLAVDGLAVTFGAVRRDLGPNPHFKVTPSLNADCLRNPTTYRQLQWNTTGDLCASLECHFDWPWVTLGDLAKYSMTRSIARSLCGSWAGCHRVWQ